MHEKQEWEKKLDASIKRVEDAFSRNKGSVGRIIEALIVAAGTEALEQVGEAIKRKQDERREREEQRRRKEEERRRRQLEEQAAARPQGLVLGLAAAIALTFAIMNTATLWWLFFVAFGLAMGSVSLLSKASERDRLLREQRQQAQAALQSQAAAAQSPIDARVARVDAVCEKILAEITSGPQIVREVIHRPEQTLAALRKACHELAKREAELRAAITPAEEQRLRAERDALSMRIAQEKDEVVRGRLGLAFCALEQQLAQRAELATAASRYEAESTRILYTLESLHTQILRARSADASSSEVAGAGLRRSLEQLSDEIDAVAEALESVNRMDTSGVSPVAPIEPLADGSGGGSRKRERS
ncbi:MAG: hypothetical protein ACOX6T_00400 [Myxococcales bacterium]|jgi:hypothetical protein